jgi:hypothetical protein
MTLGVVNPMSLLSWSNENAAALAETPCKCDEVPGLSVCVSCHARWHIMEQVYGSSNAAEIAMSFADDALGLSVGLMESVPMPEESEGQLKPPVIQNLVVGEMFDYEIDVENHMVKIGEGSWVPINEIEQHITDKDELDAVIEAYCDTFDSQPMPIASLERPD